MPKSATKLGMALAIGLLVAGACGVETVPTGRVTPPSSQKSTPATSTWAPPTSLTTPTPIPQQFVPPATTAVEVPTQVEPKPTKAHPKTTQAKAPDPVECGSDHYRNTDGVCVHRPASGPGAADGATALCRDGSYSYSQNRRGTCSGHGGVRTWL